MRPFLLIFIGLLAFREINAKCADLIEKYYQCQHLKMNITLELKKDPIFILSTYQVYKPDSSIPGNSLNDSFYEEKLANMNFDKAMDLFWTIYDVTNNCNTEFCNCVSWGIIDPNFAKLFRNRKTFEYLKRVLKDIDQKFTKLPNHDNYFPFDLDDSPSLNDFCSKFDYSHIMSLYEESSMCLKPTKESSVSIKLI